MLSSKNSHFKGTHKGTQVARVIGVMVGFSQCQLFPNRCSFLEQVQQTDQTENGTFGSYFGEPCDKSPLNTGLTERCPKAPLALVLAGHRQQ